MGDERKRKRGWMREYRMHEALTWRARGRRQKKPRPVGGAFDEKKECSAKRFDKRWEEACIGKGGNNKQEESANESLTSVLARRRSGTKVSKKARRKNTQAA